MTQHRIEKEIQAATCAECGEIRMSSPSGSVCPNLHGKIHPRLAWDIERKAKTWKRIQAMPKAVRIKPHSKFFRLSERQGLFVLKRHRMGLTPPLDAVPEDGCCFAAIWGRTIKVRQFIFSREERK